MPKGIYVLVVALGCTVLFFKGYCTTIKNPPILLMSRKVHFTLKRNL